MRGYNVPIDLGAIGLRKSDKRQLNKSGLTECLGFRLGTNGLEEPIYTTCPTEFVVDYPFPQLFKIPCGTFLLTRRHIYQVNSNWSLTIQYELSEPVDHWEVLDFGAFVIFCSEQIRIGRDAGNGSFEMVSESMLPACNTACNFKGQVFVGNTILGDGWIQWGAIGALEWTINRSNEAGKRRVHWDGKVLKLLRLADSIVAYGDNGIGILTPTSTKESATGVHYSEYSAVGLAAKTAIDGDLTKHVFVDTKGRLCKKTKDSLEVLGYEEFFYSMLGSDIVVVFNPVEDEFYVTNGSSSYTLTKQGLTQTNRAFYSGIEFDGEFLSINNVVSSSNPKRIVSNPFDLGLRAGKTITQITTGMTNTGLRVALDWRNSSEGSFSRTPFFPVNPSGVVDIQADAVEFRVVLSWPNEVTPNTDGEVIVTYKSTDKRSRRGTNAPASAES